MHIELTDHLRCPQPHDEAFLVLLPHRMDGRRVVSGHLGCPVCGWSAEWHDAVPTFGEVVVPDDAAPFDAEAALALLGLEGPGGWVAVAGRAGALAGDLATLLPEVRIVAVNPPRGVEPSDWVSLVRSPAWPIKRHAMRGVVLGEGSGTSATAGLASVLPGLRVAGEGPPPPLGPGDELVAAVEGLWVIRKG